MARKNRTRRPVQVKTNTHQDKRVNIPTQEQSNFMTDEQRQPHELLYPRDTALDPQLVWTGKDEQDSHPLSVLSKPIYVQEKIHPIAIIENIKAQQETPAQPQMSLFADFNGIVWEDQIDFYQHQQNWTNRLILGDSLQVMASLTDREGLKGQVQMIYLDPPYGIKFGSNWQISTQDRSVKDNVKGLTRQPEQVKAFRDTWELGIHSYLAYLRDRLTLCRELLTETGSIFIQIGEDNVHLVRVLLDEVFGNNNFVSQINFKKTSGAGSPGMLLQPASVSDYILWYAKDSEHKKFRHLFLPKGFDEGGADAYRQVKLPNGSSRRLARKEVLSPKLLPVGSKIFRVDNLTSQSGVEKTKYPVKLGGKTFTPNQGVWKTSKEGMQRLIKAGRVHPGKTSLGYIRYLDDFSAIQLTNLWDDTTISGSSGKVYVVQTIEKIIQRCILMTTEPGDIVLDPTCGSGTTAFVAEYWGRRWITIDTSRVALALARTRLMSSRYPYFQLSDPSGNDLRLGFKYKTVPHIMLRDIANNDEIDEIYARWQEKLEPIHGRLNHLLNQIQEDWQIPHQPEDDWPLEAKQLLPQYWQYRQQRQAEIDESIAHNSDQETLYDQPLEDNKIVRVTGPFTVESLSPYKPISPAVAAAQPANERTAQEQANTGKYEQLIIENLREAGVQNTKQNERLHFDILEPAEGGIYIHAEGEYTDKNNQAKRVAVCIGPEHGTVGKDLIRAAAREAVTGLAADLLLICGFSFDPEVSEEVRQYGRLAVLPVRMNPDLTMASLLKKTDKANLFMVFGEPDINLDRNKDGQIIVTLHGLDIYDPTTGEIRSSSTKDIACWFIDTNYDGNSFFVRHAYFTGAGNPYDSLKRALRAEINEKAWKALYRTTSLPFAAPATGNIAIKVINHYGDEVLKIYNTK